ncbi:MAG TPA: DUF308 domain-containing protein [Opitutales bacterium]|nr:DUF308 domain-containing protein [Opitutales bacterium]
MPEINSTLLEKYELSPELITQNAKRTRWVGIACIAIGVFAILLPGIFTIGFEIILGILLIIGGLLQVANAQAYHSRYWGLPLISGLLSIIIGGLFLFNPFTGAAALSIILAALFFIGGISRMVHSIRMPGIPGSGFGFLNGLLGILIAVIVVTGWPSSSLWLIGVLIGIDFLILGFWLTSFASECERASS